MQIIRVARLKTKNKHRDNMPKNKNKVPVILTEDEIMNILNRFSTHFNNQILSDL